MTKAVTGLCMGCMGLLKGQRVCPHCGYDADTVCDKNYIKAGTLLDDRYLVGRVAHRNGEGAQYIGFDTNIQQPVWIQEYFPHTIAQRGEETGNVLALQGYGAQYKALMSDFVDICNEIKRLSITEPVIPIENMVYANNTVYAIYKDMDVMPLETWLSQQGGGLPLDKTLDMFLPLLNTLSNIHSHGAIHRGISPYTVYVDRNGKLYLWDFALSAVRTADSELESELFSGYSAPEQYSSNGWQDTWTDVYAIGALLYRTLSGVVPPKSTLIGPRRPLVPLEDLVMGLPKDISEAIGEAMHPQSDQRTQAMATLTSQLLQNGMSSTAVYDTNFVQRTRNPEPPPLPKAKANTGKYVAITMVVTVLVLIGIMVFFGSMMGIFESSSSSAAPPPASEPETGASEPETSAVDTAVPRFVGLRAIDVTGNANYTERFEFSIKYEFNDEFADGVIFEQSPQEGVNMPERGTIILSVSKGPELIEMPDLSGLTLDEAVDILKAMDLRQPVEVFTRISSTADPNTVLYTTPASGEEFNPQRQAVYLFVTPEEEEEEVVESSESSSSTSSSSRSSSSSSSSSASSSGPDDIIIFHN